MDFPAYIAADPELTPYARGMFLNINTEAERVAARIVANTTSDELRTRDGSPWLKGINHTMAVALERDPSGRLAAVPALRAWAYMAEVPQMWITLYAVLLEKYLDHIKQPLAQAAE